MWAYFPNSDKFVVWFASFSPLFQGKGIIRVGFNDVLSDWEVCSQDVNFSPSCVFVCFSLLQCSRAEQKWSDFFCFMMKSFCSFSVQKRQIQKKNPKLLFYHSLECAAFRYGWGSKGWMEDSPESVSSRLQVQPRIFHWLGNNQRRRATKTHWKKWERERERERNVSSFLQFANVIHQVLLSIVPVDLEKGRKNSFLSAHWITWNCLKLGLR